MRHLTAVGAATVLLAAGIAAASAAAADPADPATPEATGSAPASTAAATSEAPASGEASTSGEPTAAAETTSPSPSSETAAGGHQVTYTVTTTSDLTANIYYVSADPPDQAAANDPQYMPMARTLVGPGAPWTVQANLEDPTKWAFVSASGGLRVNPEFRCEIAVDGQVVVTQQGGSGVQCALRPW